MLQVMDNMEASCVFDVKVGTFTHLEHNDHVGCYLFHSDTTLTI